MVAKPDNGPVVMTILTRATLLARRAGRAILTRCARRPLLTRRYFLPRRCFLALRAGGSFGTRLVNGALGIDRNRRILPGAEFVGARG